MFIVKSKHAQATVGSVNRACSQTGRAIILFATVIIARFIKKYNDYFERSVIHIGRFHH
jgi:hypothetical protein